MPRTNRIVINTSPLIALVAAQDNLKLLDDLYEEVLVPKEVCQEIEAGGVGNFAVKEFRAATWLQKQQTPLTISSVLLNELDIGEAAVIQLALNRNIQTVCIDEVVGRRIAIANNLTVTGSIGILLKAKQLGMPIIIKSALNKMVNQGIRLSPTVINFALTQAGEN